MDNDVIKAYAKQMGVPPPQSAGGTGNYTIARLFMQLEGIVPILRQEKMINHIANIWTENPSYYPQGSNFQGEDWSKETPATQANLATLLYAWMTQMMQSGQTNIGIMLQTDHPETGMSFCPSLTSKLDRLTGLFFCV
jgi:hypothetical protein